MANTLRIALNRPIRRLFDYLPPAGQTFTPGQRIRVPFGRQKLIGLITETGATPPQGVTLKPALETLESWPLLPPETLKLLTWAAGYYHHPIGECLFMALPPALRRGQPAEQTPTPDYIATSSASADQLPTNAARQRSLLEWLKQRGGPVSATEIRQHGYTTAQISSLLNKGVIAKATPAETRTDPLPALSEAQMTTFSELPPAGSGFCTTLLIGVTGSGKTELYLHYLQERLPTDQQALVLVPEINLTPQTVTRFRRYFGDRVALWHSALNDSQRLQTWLRVRRGEPVILIGTRSAALLPFTSLGALIVDEEHDSSYKQGEGFRYSARDLAVYRGHLNDCPVILGSATPSLESLHNADTGKYRLATLSVRAGNARPPRVQLLDIRSRPLQGGLSAPALSRLRETLDRGHQALVFINRRGYAPVLMCNDCSHIIECPHCDSRLTYHRRDRALRCHHCEHQAAAPRNCPACNSGEMHAIGQGTERTEETLLKHFPDTPVIRVDRDTTQRKGAMDSLISTVHTGKPCILVGTQMLAKGHDFHKVTLVIVVNADGGLFSADFRAPEQMTQILMQVAGRAGRGDDAGEVLIQTCHSDHPLLSAIARGDYPETARQLLAQRKPFELPPFRNMAIIRAESAEMAETLAFLDAVKKDLQPGQLEIWGPLPAALARKADHHRAQLVLVAKRRQELQRILKGLCRDLEQHRLSARVRWQIDVDPLETG